MGLNNAISFNNFSKKQILEGTKGKKESNVLCIVFMISRNSLVCPLEQWHFTDFRGRNAQEEI